MKKEISFIEIQQHHKIECPAVSIEFFMEQYCKGIFKESDRITSIEIIVSPRLRFYFSK